MPARLDPLRIGEVSEACPGLAASAQADQKNLILGLGRSSPQKILRQSEKHYMILYVYMIHINGQCIFIDMYGNKFVLITI